MVREIRTDEVDTGADDEPCADDISRGEGRKCNARSCGIGYDATSDDAGQRCPAQIRAGNIRIGENRAGEITTGDVRTNERYPREVNIREIQVSCDDTGAEEYIVGRCAGDIRGRREGGRRDTDETASTYDVRKCCAGEVRAGDGGVRKCRASEVGVGEIRASDG